MNLNVSDKTFIKNLSSEVNIQNISFIDFKEFISVLRDMAKKDIIAALNESDFDKVCDIVNSSRGYLPSLTILVPGLEHTFEEISTSYISNAMKKPALKQFYEVRVAKVTEATKINAQKLKFLREIESKVNTLIFNKGVFALFLRFIKKETNYFTMISDLRQNLFNTYFTTSSASFVKADQYLREHSTVQLDKDILENCKKELIEIMNEFNKAIFARNYKKYNYNPYSKENFYAKNDIVRFKEIIEAF